MEVVDGDGIATWIGSDFRELPLSSKGAAVGVAAPAAVSAAALRSTGGGDSGVGIRRRMSRISFESGAGERGGLDVVFRSPRLTALVGVGNEGD